jgi:uncharacterized protein YodC (DUF2158 family)
MSDAELKVGDVVTLKSGGPKMTVEQIGKFSMSSTAHNRAKCTWFDGTKKLDALFELVTIQKT